MVRLSVSAIYDEHQKAKTRKRRPFHTPLPRLARAASSVNGLSSTSSVPNHDPLVDAHRRLIGEVFFRHSQVEDMMARRDLLVQQVRASARWELMKEWLEKRVEHWDPEEEYRRHLFLSRGIDQQSGTFSLVATPRSVVGS
ncbi:BnaC05g25540D [Brassica napus]|uniref:BnaC05g25540D protein n=1 Tax=Brassica napus TaxID=3708 RepID=A0A078GGU6_BRANA|nr:BnaC05g25540D [Brassica napus]